MWSVLLKNEFMVDFFFVFVFKKSSPTYAVKFISRMKYWIDRRMNKQTQIDR